ncbi:hypothetical protein RB195_005536 [Necator americanus]|uniref:L-Fucosyltransferase n=1 Tax=Necator americanus TaxID=51031 RepID=A0ABR1BND2_NECAM
MRSEERGRDLESDQTARLANHKAKFLLLDTKFLQNARYIEDYLPEVVRLLTFADEIRDQGKTALERLQLSYVSAMCVHIRRTDFVSSNTSTDGASTVRITRRLAREKGLYRFLIFGDDRKFMRWIAEDLELDEHKNRRFIASISTFSEGVDFYVSSQACAAFFMSAPISTFGWWLAFFTPNQSAVYYMDDKRPMKDKVPSKDLFL